jgi:transporter family protein
VLPILSGLTCYFAWSSGDIFVTMATRKSGAFLASLFNFIFTFFIYLLYIPFALKDLNNLTLGILVICIVLGIVSALSFFGFNQALRIGNASAVGAVSGSFGAVVVVLSLIFLKETLSVFQLLGIFIIFLGILLTLLNFNEIKKGQLFNNKGFYLSLLVMLGWGIYHAFIKIPVRQIGWFWPAFIATIAALAVYFLIGLKQSKSLKAMTPKIYLYVFIAAGLFSLGEFAYNYGLLTGSASVIAPIAGAYPTLFVVLSRFFFKDKLNKQQTAGIITTLVGIVFLAFFSR